MSEPVRSRAGRLKLQRGQHRRERLPQRVPAGAAEPAGEHRRGARQHVRLYRRGRNRAAADIPRLFQRAGRGAGRQHRLVHGHELDERDLPRFLAARNPNPFQCHEHHQHHGHRPDERCDAADNAARAGIPANFFVANPDYLGGAEFIGNGGYTKYNSLQLELRKRLTHGLQFQSSYVFGKALFVGALLVPHRAQVRAADRHRRRRAHAFKANWTYELPFGEGRRFGGSSGPWMDRLIGGWSFDGIARLQSGQMLDFGNVRLIGMTKEELQDSFKLRFDDAGRAIYMLPQDIYENTLRAYSVSATTASGYSGEAPTGRYIAPANGPDCIEIAQNYGECGLNNVVVTGPRLVRFDLSAVKRVPMKGRIELRVPRGVPERLQPSVVRPGTRSRIGPRRLPRRKRRHGTAGSTDLAPELVGCRVINSQRSG